MIGGGMEVQKAAALSGLLLPEDAYPLVIDRPPIWLYLPHMDER